MRSLVETATDTVETTDTEASMRCEADALSDGVGAVMLVVPAGGALTAATDTADA